MAGLLGFNNAIQARQTLGGNHDANTIILPGMYRLSNTTTNFPVTYGMLIVYAADYAYLQFAVSYDLTKRYLRVKWDTTWSTWSQI